MKQKYWALVSDICLLGGGICFVYGAFRLSGSVGWLTLGVLLLVFGWLLGASSV